MTTATSSFTVLQIVGRNDVPDGERFKITTDSDLYGTTVEKKGKDLINVSTGEPIHISVSELVTMKLKPVSSDKKVGLHDFLNAYKEGKKVKVVIGEDYRYLQITEDNIPENLPPFMAMFSVKAVSEDSIMTMEELTEGTFYIVE